MNCAFCHTPIAEARIGFREECPKCGGDLHICLTCRFYDPHVSRQCREPAIPEGVQDKERRNLCEYFNPAPAAPGKSSEQPPDAARKQLEALFKK